MQIQANTLLFSLSLAFDSVERDLLGVSLNHSKRVSYISMRICQYLGMDNNTVSDMASCCILHDNALTEYMLYKDVDILKKLENIESHCNVGEQNIKDFPFVGDASGIVLYHHENWDGSGFFKLKGTEFSDRAAILRLADNIDLIFALGVDAKENSDDLIFHCQVERGKLYAPHIVDAFLSLLDSDCEFLDNLNNKNIDLALNKLTPCIVLDVSAAELLPMCNIFSRIIDAKSKFTLHHSQGIAQKAEIMAKYYMFESEHINKFVMSAHLHDVGKLIVPTSILEKPAGLTNHEFKVIKNHAQATFEILSIVDGLESIPLWASSHHEKLDGTGYPAGIAADEIPFESRLLTCIDIYQALIEDRPYRAGLTHKVALEILKKMVEKGEIDGKIVNDLDKVLTA